MSLRVTERDELQVWLSSDCHREAAREALTIRMIEERLLELFKEGKLFGTIHTCIGQEFVGVAITRALQPQDTIFSSHRCHGHFLAYRRNLVGLIGEIMGKEVGVCGGRGGSQHLHQERFYSNGIQGGITPVSAGLAFGHKLKENEAISVVYIGDGTLGEGVLYESMNIASKWQLPLLFVCENNLYAQSTNQAQTLSGSIRARAEAFGIDTDHGNTWDWSILLDSAAANVSEVRSHKRPRFFQIVTYRLMAHSKGDDNRTDDEIACYKEKDPLNRLLKVLGDDPRLIGMLEEIGQDVDEAVAVAEAATFGQLAVSPRKSEFPNCEFEVRDFPRERVVESVRRGLESGLSEHENMILIGEDLESPYGGAFKCTAGLSERFPGRVRNTPISEAAIVGIGNGLALSGFIPVVEIMFGDFLTLAADQWINHAAKFRWMYNDQVRIPLVVRTPMGGKRGYAATHSQSIEKHFLGLPGTRVLSLHHRYSPAQLYEALFKDIDCPTLVIENKVLYSQFVSSKPPNGFKLLFTNELFPNVNLRPYNRADLTMVAIGGIALDAEEAVLRLFDEEEIVVDLFLPTCLYPFSVQSFSGSLTETKKLLVVEEGQGFVSMSSEIIAQVAEYFSDLGIRCSRLVAASNPIPASRPLEEQCLPTVQSIMSKTMELVCEPAN